VDGRSQAVKTMLGLPADRNRTGVGTPRTLPATVPSRPVTTAPGRGGRPAGLDVLAHRRTIDLIWREVALRMARLGVRIRTAGRFFVAQPLVVLAVVMACVLALGIVFVVRHRPHARPPVAVVPPPPDPVAIELQAADDAIKRQHWLAPKGESVYDSLKRLAQLAPADPRVAELRQRTVDVLERKGAEALQGRRFHEAEVAYRSLARIDAKTEHTQKALARALAGQAETALVAGKKEAAAHTAKEALALDPGQVVAEEVLSELEQDREAKRTHKRKRR